MSEYQARLIDKRKTVFVPSDDPSYAWKTICSLYQALPGLRGFWPMSATTPLDITGTTFVPDQSGHGFPLQYVAANGDQRFGYVGLIPYVTVFGSGAGGAAYLIDTNTSQYRVTGTETYIRPLNRGLTLGAWWRFSTTSIAEGLMGKDDLTYSYYVEKRTDNTTRFVIAGPGGGVGVTSTGVIDGISWHLIIGRYQPSNNMSIFLNGEKVDVTTGIPVSIANSEARFYVGNRTQTATLAYQKDVSMAFICAMSLSDALCQNIWHQTRAMFGR